MTAKEQIRIDLEPRRLVVTSEPYIIYTRRGYQPVMDVIERKSKREYFLYISAISIASSLEQLRKENAGKFIGIEFWIRKQGTEKYAKYIVED